MEKEKLTKEFIDDVLKADYVAELKLRLLIERIETNLLEGIIKNQK